jgi:hypothetical protein
VRQKKVTVGSWGSAFLRDREEQQHHSGVSKITPEKTRKMRLLVGILCASLVILLYPHLKPKHPDVPRDLIGTWRTNSTSHSDRFLEIGEARISVGTGEDQVSTGFIENIEIQDKSGKALYRISFSVEGVQNQVYFYFDAAQQTIQFQNQPNMLWKKDDIR